MGTHLAYVIFMHHFSQQMRKNPDTDNDSKCVIFFFFLVKSLLMCGMVGAEDLDIMERALFLQPSYLGFNINDIID